MTTGKIIALTIWTFVGKRMSLLFITLSRFVRAFLPKSKWKKRLKPPSWLQPPSAVILEPKKTKSVTVSIFLPSICHEVMRPDALILVFFCLFVLFCFFLCSERELSIFFFVILFVFYTGVELIMKHFYGSRLGLTRTLGTCSHPMLSFKPAFSLFSFNFIKRLFGSSLLSAI